MLAYIFLADGFEEIEAITLVDILRRGGAEAVTVSISEDYNVEGAHGITVKADLLFGDITDGDILILPGGMPGTTNLKHFTPLTELLISQASSNGYIAAICAAPSIIGELGLLSGKKATCFSGFEKSLRGACIVSDSVVVDGCIITSRGAGTAAELAFEIIRLFYGDDDARALKEQMLYD